MATEVLLVQVLVLGVTAALWWIARRDLIARRDPAAGVLPLAPTAADTAELEQLCATLETLVVSLSRRLDAVERAAVSPLAVSLPAPPVMDAVPVMDFVPVINAAPAETSPDPRYLPVYALLALGVSDPVEIARRTGLGRGEVDLILSLRDRRAF